MTTPRLRADGQSRLQRNFAAEHAAGLVGDLQVPVTREVKTIDVQGDECALGGEFAGGGGHFEHGGAFIDFIEHGAIDHGATGGGGVVSLPPIEDASAPGNLVQGAASEVAPGKPGKDHGHVIDLVGGGFEEIRSDQVLAEGIGLWECAVTPDGPGAEDIE